MNFCSKHANRLLLILVLTGGLAACKPQENFPRAASTSVLAPAVPTMTIIQPIMTASSDHAQTTSPDGIWSDTPRGQLGAMDAPLINTRQHRDVTLNEDALQQLLQTTPLERTTAARNTAVLFNLPLPDGTFGRFRIVESPIMAPELAAEFPEIKTYAGQGIDDPTATVRFDWTPAGFHAMILSANATVFIDPRNPDDTIHYISYFKRDFLPPPGKTFTEPTR